MVLEVPAPRLEAGCVLIQSQVTLISAGTERMLVDFGRASPVQKIRQQPEKVQQVLEKIRTDGLVSTLDAVRSKLDQPLPLGYCNSGVVVEVGEGVTGFKIGDRVLSNGGHASLVSVPKNLCALIPPSVSDEHAAFTVIAAIGLQGVRLVAPTLGETIVVTGLGLIGLLTVQLLRANGCKVIGVDLDRGRLALAREMGAMTIDLSAGEDAVASAAALCGGRGVDGVIITASTRSSEPVSDAARMCRKRGRIVLVGVTGLELNRAEFYEKELSFQVSCSYGPGRYDPNYEMRGNDYPLGFVRWTEQRNFEAVLALMAEGSLDPGSLVTNRYPIESATDAYDRLVNDPGALGILLEYPRDNSQKLRERCVDLVPASAIGAPVSAAQPVVGFIGAGNYGSRMLIPAFKAADARLDTVVTSSGLGGVHHGRKMGFARASTDVADVLENDTIEAVAVATRHNTHADFVRRALERGKHVFVEKPLALKLDEVAEIERVIAGLARPPLLMVGFNRRFAPLVVKLKSLLNSVREPKAFIYTCNAGAIPANHWTQDPAIGGGRIVGEACHFIDLLRFLTGARIREYGIATLGRGGGNSDGSTDKATITLQFEDGSVGTIHYLANGGKVFPKERIEVFAGGGVLQLDNFRALRAFGWRGFNKRKLWKQDKGQAACVAAFLGAIRSGGAPPIPLGEVLEVARISIRLAQFQADGS